MLYEVITIDHFSEKAIKDFLAFYDSTAVGHDLSGLRAFFNDSYEVDRITSYNVCYTKLLRGVVWLYLSGHGCIRIVSSPESSNYESYNFV